MRSVRSALVLCSLLVLLVFSSLSEGGIIPIAKVEMPPQIILAQWKKLASEFNDTILPEMNRNGGRNKEIVLSEAHLDRRLKSIIVIGERTLRDLRRKLRKALAKAEKRDNPWIEIQQLSDDIDRVRQMTQQARRQYVRIFRGLKENRELIKYQAKVVVLAGASIHSEDALSFLDLLCEQYQIKNLDVETCVFRIEDLLAGGELDKSVYRAAVMAVLQGMENIKALAFIQLLIDRGRGVDGLFLNAMLLRQLVLVHEEKNTLEMLDRRLLDGYYEKLGPLMEEDPDDSGWVLYPAELTLRVLARSRDPKNPLETIYRVLRNLEARMVQFGGLSPLQEAVFGSYAVSAGRYRLGISVLGSLLKDKTRIIEGRLPEDLILKNLKTAIFADEMLRKIREDFFQKIQRKRRKEENKERARKARVETILADQRRRAEELEKSQSEERKVSPESGKKQGQARSPKILGNSVDGPRAIEEVGDFEVTTGRKFSAEREKKEKIKRRGIPGSSPPRTAKPGPKIDDAKQDENDDDLPVEEILSSRVFSIFRLFFSNLEDTPVPLKKVKITGGELKTVLEAFAKKYRFEIDPSAAKGSHKKVIVTDMSGRDKGSMTLADTMDGQYLDAWHIRDFQKKFISLGLYPRDLKDKIDK